MVDSPAYGGGGQEAEEGVTDQGGDGAAGQGAEPRRQEGNALKFFSKNQKAPLFLNSRFARDANFLRASWLQKAPLSREITRSGHTAWPRS